MKVLVLQHADFEHPGYLRDLLQRDGHTWIAVELDAGQVAPRLDGFDALWVMGGPQDTWEEDTYPWLAPEKALIREAVADRGMPFLGLCLGHQLLACALGGACGPSETPEIGIMDVAFTPEGAQSPFFDGVASPMRALQWHSAEVTHVPEGASVLAASPACKVQAMSWGEKAFSMQFHMEVESDTCGNWAQIPTYADALEKALGPTGLADITKACEASMPAFNRDAARVYANWLKAATAS